MGAFAGFVVRHGEGISLFFVGWLVLSVVAGFVYGQACRIADRRDGEMREFLSAAGRDARDVRLAESARLAMAAAIELDAAERDARAMARLRKDLGPTRPPLVAVPSDFREAV